MLCIPSQLYKWSGLADWTRDIEEQIIPLCRELGIGIVQFNPLGPGFVFRWQRSCGNFGCK
ncbi:hypothetical protein RGQ29_014413 [Quercus rubra]|uniref:NADP-dependent oxidoreductase domain-containing protein n=1 Tax=Quercus rubra TaxID=3512 RepID=A0AAN7FME6_QUERU|nr:hypothetical protein RGQ29_014413 [Quercus rubra]